MAPEAREICGPGLKLRITYAEDDPVVDCIGRLTSGEYRAAEEPCAGDDSAKESDHLER